MLIYLHGLRLTVLLAVSAGSFQQSNSDCQKSATSHALHMSSNGVLTYYGYLSES